jgi:uncharacterized protein (UPF0332 family)
MTEDQKDLLEEARDSISAADLLLTGGFQGYAVSRAYYAMFYLAEAFPEGLGLSFSKHSAGAGATRGVAQIERGCGFSSFVGQSIFQLPAG